MSLYELKKPGDLRTAILAGICEKENAGEFESAMRECEALCEACGIHAAAVLTQNSRNADTRTAFRSGKLEELVQTVEREHADLVIFYNSLTMKAAQRIAEACQVPVIDRTSLILDIFSQRARTRQAKLQTEMARLQYDLPRVLENDNSSGHERGGSASNRGAGEMRSALIQRRYKARISELKEELRRIEKQRYQDEARRSKTLLGRCALVGYTNAGKSSLMNAMLRMSEGSGSEVMEKDMLFATLDTSVRLIRLQQRGFLLYDTVGFVSNLPHMLIEAFRSTLDAAKDADLLLHVIDASDPAWNEKAAITDETLKEIGAGEVPVLRIFAKTDLIEPQKRPQGCCISSLTGEGIEELYEEICSRLYPQEEVFDCVLPYSRASLMQQSRLFCSIEILSQEEDGYHLRISGPRRSTAAFAPYRI